MRLTIQSEGVYTPSKENPKQMEITNRKVRYRYAGSQKQDAEFSEHACEVDVPDHTTLDPKLGESVCVSMSPQDAEQTPMLPGEHDVTMAWGNETPCIRRTIPSENIVAHAESNRHGFKIVSRVF
jgi:hypothetical protein